MKAQVLHLAQPCKHAEQAGGTGQAVVEPRSKRKKGRQQDRSVVRCLSGLRSSIEEEVQIFSGQPCEPYTDPLQWCSTQSEFPHLAPLAGQLLAIPATAVPSERAFSTAGVIV